MIMYVKMDGDNFTKINRSKNIKVGDKHISDINKADNNTLKELGIYKYQAAEKPPQYKIIKNRYHTIDHSKGVVTEVIEAETKDVSDLKQQKEKVLQRQLDNKLRACDHIVLEAIELNEDVPEGCKTYRKAVREKKQQVTEDLANLTNAEEVYNYTIEIPEYD